MMLAFIIPSSWTKGCMLTTSADSFFAKSLACIQFLWMLLLQVRVKIVTSPRVAEVIDVCGPF